MPNYAYNKIELNVTEEQAKEIEEQVAPTGKFDFNTLIEVPLHFIRITSRDEMDLSEETNQQTNEDFIFLIKEDQKDFPHPQDWKLENCEPNAIVTIPKFLMKVDVFQYPSLLLGLCHIRLLSHLEISSKYLSDLNILKNRNSSGVLRNMNPPSMWKDLPVQ